MRPDLMRQEVAYGASYRNGYGGSKILESGAFYLVQAGGQSATLLLWVVGRARGTQTSHGSAVIGRKRGLGRAGPPTREHDCGAYAPTIGPMLVAWQAETEKSARGAGPFYLYRDGEDTYFPPAWN